MTESEKILDITEPGTEEIPKPESPKVETKALSPKLIPEEPKPPSPKNEPKPEKTTSPKTDTISQPDFEKLIAQHKMENNYHNLYKILCLFTIFFTGITKFFYLAFFYTLYSYWEQLNNWNMLIYGSIASIIWSTLQWYHLFVFVGCVNIYENRLTIIEKLKQYKAKANTYIQSQIENKNKFFVFGNSIYNFCQSATESVGYFLKQVKGIFSSKKLDKLNTFIGDKMSALLDKPQNKTVTEKIKAFNFHVNKIFFLCPVLIETGLNYLNATEKLAVLDQKEKKEDDLMALFKDNPKTPAFTVTPVSVIPPPKKFSGKDIEKIIMSKQQRKRHKNKKLNIPGVNPVKLPDMAELEKMEKMLQNPVLSSIMKQMAEDNKMLKQMEQMFH